ncbi:MAG: LptF/LptG family permease [Trueperaceae bacterium]|nr:LptF/LptG family permease [Trueperaceae bacterium]
MARLATYLIRETTGLYLLGVAAFCLMLSIDFLTVWAKFLIEQEASLATVGKLMLYQSPWFLHMSLPIAVVFAVLLATGRLAKDSELKAAYALGVPPLALLWPLLLFGLVVSGVTLVNNGYVEPRAEISYDRVVDSFYYERPPAETRSDVSYVIAGEGIYYAGRVRADQSNRDLAELNGVLVAREDGQLISAADGVWDSEARVWTLEEARGLEPGGTPVALGQVRLPFDTGGGASETLADSATLTLPQLANLLDSVRTTGGETRTLSFEFHRRIADAFSALIFTLIAGALGLHLRGRSLGFAWTIVLLVFFYFVWTLSGDLFERGVLGPFVAAWFTSALVGGLGFGLALVRLR